MKVPDRYILLEDHNDMRVLIAGDFCPIGLHDVRYLDSIIPYFKSCDLNIVNFECSCRKDGFKKIYKEGPALGCNDDEFGVIKSIPVNLLSLANNHILDYGIEGLKLVLQNAKKAGVNTVGAGLSLQEAKVPFLFNQSGFTLAVINCCESEFSVADRRRPGANPAEPISIYRQICKAKEIADAIIVIVHGGHEYYPLPSPRIQNLYRFFIDSGACAVIGHHPHCYSGMEKYHEGVIFYSLGNFFFNNGDLNHSAWNDGFLVELNIDNQTYNVSEYEIIPYTQCAGDNSVIVLNEKNKQQFFSEFERLTSIIADESLLHSYFNDYIESENKKALSRILPYSNHYLVALYKRGLLPSFLSRKAVISHLNALQCESHRDMIIKCLKKYLE